MIFCVFSSKKQENTRFFMFCWILAVFFFFFDHSFWPAGPPARCLRRPPWLRAGDSRRSRHVPGPNSHAHHPGALAGQKEWPKKKKKKQSKSSKTWKTLCFLAFSMEKHQKSWKTHGFSCFAGFELVFFFSSATLSGQQGLPQVVREDPRAPVRRSQWLPNI